MIDEEWNRTKEILKRTTTEDTSLSNNPLNIFWQALREERFAERTPLTIIDADGNELEPKKAVESCSAYLQTIWSKATPYKVVFTSNTDLSETPNIHEISKAVDDLRKDAAMGRDKIPPGLVKGNQQAIIEYCRLFNILWKIPTKIPKEWRDMKVKPIPKTNSRTMPIGARPITCLATSAKIMNRIKTNRNEERYESVLHNDIHAYRKDRSSWTAITSTCLRCLITFLGKH